ncbi:MAG TPA: TIR domain-containing protein, partial [Blastocatellia bacterium]|nr:TIR domain-containing protein [Blastocatellia bacterium]
MTNATDPRRFAVALSFPGEHRRFVKSVASRLAEVLGENRVFYDEWYEAELVGIDGDLKLRRYYRDESEMVVPFFSEHYEKDWCQIEWSAIRAMLKTRRKENAVIPIQLDRTRIEGWEEIDFAIRKKSRSARQIADLIIEAYRLRFPVSVAPQDDRRSGETSGLSASRQAMRTHPAISDRIPIDITRIIKYAPDKLIGREAETSLLNDAWGKVQSQEVKRPHILTFVALGGEGKTSLVAKWSADLAYQNWPGCDAVFAWSFYSQGTRDQVAASSDLFLKEALNFFGDDDDREFAASNAGAYEKGQRLARIVGERRALLILDGLEPLQYAPTSPTAGELKDQGIAALLKGLAANSRGLGVVTTRYALPDLRAFVGNTVHEEKLARLSTDAGVALLQSLGVRGSLRKTIPSADGRTLWNEYEKLVEDVKGHALTLNLLGTYLRDAHAGDIRQRDLIKLEEADTEEQSGHAFHVMDAYVKLF